MRGGAPASLKTGSLWFENYMCTVSPQSREATGALTPPEASLWRWLNQSHQWGCELASAPHLRGAASEVASIWKLRALWLVWSWMLCPIWWFHAGLAKICAQGGRPQAYPPPHGCRSSGASILLVLALSAAAEARSLLQRPHSLEGLSMSLAGAEKEAQMAGLGHPLFPSQCGGLPPAGCPELLRGPDS